MSQTVTELVIDADTSGADAYTRAMDGAADAAARGTGAASGFNLGLAVLGTGLAAAAITIKQGLDYVVEFNKGLADMGQVASRVGLSLKDLQAIEFGGQVKGLSESQINTGLEKSAQLLNDAQRNANTLSKEFEANGLSIRNGNGQLISQNQLLQIAADLVRRAASPQDAIAIAQMLGFTKEWVPLLEQGAAHIRSLGDEAQKAGAIINDETVKRAADFDDKWRKSSVEWTTYMKAAIAEMLPAVDDFIDKAVRLIQDVKQRAKATNDIPQAVAESAAGSALSAIGVDPKRGIAIDTDRLQDAIHEWQQQPVFSTDTWVGFGKALWSGFAAQASPEDAAKLVPGLASRQIIEPSYPTAAQMDAAFDRANPPNPGSRAQPLTQFGLTAADYEASNPSKVATRDTGGDAVDRAINNLRRHTEQQEADTKAVGLGAGALAGFRAEAVETSAVQANNGKETEAQKKAFADLRTEAIGAAEALAKAKVASQIDFGRKTAFLTQDDVAIATQLSKIYGNDVPAALNSTEAAQLRLNKTMRDTSDAFQNAAAPALVDFEMGAKSGSDAIKAFEQQFVKSLLNMANQALIFGPISKALQGITTGGLSSLIPSAHGNVFSSGNVIPFAQGGVVDSPTIAPMALFGEAGPEAIVPLRRGPDGNLGVASAGGGGTSITYQIDASGADSGTVEAIKAVLADHARTLQAQGRAMSSAQRMQATGVG